MIGEIVLVLSVISGAPPAEAATFDRVKLNLGGRPITVELADTDVRRAQGLMHRTQLKDNEGMLFVFPRAEVLTFWMKNTLLPLSIGFFDSQLRLMEVLDMEPPTSLMVKTPKTYSSRRPAIMALEMNRGWFNANAIKAGASLEWGAGAVPASLEKFFPSVKSESARPKSEP